MSDLKKCITYLALGYFYAIKVSIKLILILFALCFIAMIAGYAHSAFAADENGSWFCDTQSSKMEDGDFLTCGVGAGDEATARHLAIADAYTEWHDLHPAKGKFTVIPGRTDCTMIDKQRLVYRCVRMMRFHRKES